MKFKKSLGDLAKRLLPKRKPVIIRSIPLEYAVNILNRLEADINAEGLPGIEGGSPKDLRVVEGLRADFYILDNYLCAEIKGSYTYVPVENEEQQRVTEDKEQQTDMFRTGPRYKDIKIVARLKKL